MDYTVSWEAFNACDGQTLGSEQPRIVRGRVDGDNWIFTKAASPSPRSTVDEF